MSDYLKQFKKGKLAVNVRTEEEARKVIEYLYNNDIFFMGSFDDEAIKDINETYFEEFLDKTTYAINTYRRCLNMSKKTFGYCTKEYYDGTHKIISAQEFLGR